MGHNYTITFTKTKKGRRMLVRHGYVYHFHRETKLGTVWRCTNRSCSATIKILENHDLRILHEAAHIQETAANTSTAMPQVYEEAFQTTKNAGYALLNAIPKFSNISRSLYNARNRKLNVPKTQFSRCEEVIIPEKYKLSFLLFDDDSEPENRIIAFCDMKARDIIPNIQIFFMDGTFASCCPPFYQLYCITWRRK
ncbi:hypothetical protein ACJJTC_002076 [Scirpophaga incertulas]